MCTLGADFTLVMAVASALYFFIIGSSGFQVAARF
jgi:hypothetical protein